MNHPVQATSVMRGSKYSNPAISDIVPNRLSIGAIGVGGMNTGGGMAAWGCWDSTCTQCLHYKRVCNSAGFCWYVCDIWSEYDCERCIWPW